MPALTAVAPFTRPSTPVSQCFHKLRQTDLASRTDLVAATGLSQPTVTRAVTTLIEAGLVRPRNDKRQIKGRGRPTIPIEMVDQPVVFAGIAVGTSETYFAIYDLRGRTLRDILREGRKILPERALEITAVSYTHLTLPTNREV